MQVMINNAGMRFELKNDHHKSKANKLSLKCQRNVYSEHYKYHQTRCYVTGEEAGKQR